MYFILIIILENSIAVLIIKLLLFILSIANVIGIFYKNDHKYSILYSKKMPIAPFLWVRKVVSLIYFQRYFTIDIFR